MRGSRFVPMGVIAAALLMAPSIAMAQTADAQVVRQEIEQLRRELQAIQKQYGDRLTALETKLGVADSRLLLSQVRRLRLGVRALRRCRLVPRAPEGPAACFPCTAGLPVRRSSTPTSR